MRRTSLYGLEVAATGSDRKTILDQMKEALPTRRFGAMLGSRSVRVTFRAANDEEALSIAAKTTDEPHVLFTGFGLHWREVSPM